MERILKQNLGVNSTLRKTLGLSKTGESDSNDLLDELNLIMKRIDYLEQ